MTEEDKIYMFFSHTIKGQKDNTGILKKVMETKSTLIDYEAITDEHNKRLVYFGEYAGIAGALDMLWLLGLSYEAERIDTVFKDLRQSVYYNSLDEARSELDSICNTIKKRGIGAINKPFVIGVMGTGNVHKGVMQILNRLPIEVIKPDELAGLKNRKPDVIYVCIFEAEDIVRHKDKKDFVKQGYYANPEQFESYFVQYLPYLTAICNCMFWNKGYPHFISWTDMESIYKEGRTKLKVISDIAGDTWGGIECNTENTSINKSYYSIDPIMRTCSYGENNNILLTAVDNFPAEFPKESSVAFSNMIKKYLPCLLSADMNEDFSKSNFSNEIKSATVIYRGCLTEKFKYLNQYL